MCRQRSDHQARESELHTGKQFAQVRLKKPSVMTLLMIDQNEPAWVS